MSRHVLFTTQKNEGPFLLEWLAYHRVIGFDHAVIVSNDCSDGSDELLDAVSDEVSLLHLRHAVPGGHNAQDLGQRHARSAGALREGDWVAWLDPDEFLNSHVADGHVAQLIDRMDTASAIVMNWRLFGSSGVQTWPGLQLDPRFDRCGTRWHKSARYCKTLFRFDATIAEMRMHRPVLVDAAADAPAVLWLDSDGVPLPQSYVTGRRDSGGPHFRTPRRPRYDWVQVNHYMVRIRHLYALRQARGRGARVGTTGPRKGRRYTWMHYQKHNCNLLRDRSIHRHLPRLRAELQRLMSVPRIARAHRATLAANGLDPSCGDPC